MGLARSDLARIEQPPSDSRRPFAPSSSQTTPATCSGSKKDIVLLYADEAIDYRVQAPVYNYLAETYGTRKFDVIIDTASTQEIYQHCPQYLNEGKPFLDMTIKHPVGRAWRYSDLFPVMGNQMKKKYFLAFLPRWCS